MKIDRACNLVIRLPRESAEAVHVHSAPLSRAAFDEYALLFAKTFTMIHNEGIGPDFGPRFAANYLLTCARSMVPAGDSEEGRRAAREASGKLYERVMAEIHRLTTVVVATDRGWETLPFADAVKRDLLDEDEVSEVDSGIVFFTLAWRGYRKAERETMVTGAAKLWGGSTTSSNSTEFASSLPTSTTGGAGTASPAPGASVPS